MIKKNRSKLKFKLIKCKKKCDKKFNTDISEIIDDNSNFTHDF